MGLRKSNISIEIIVVLIILIIVLVVVSLYFASHYPDGISSLFSTGQHAINMSSSG